MKSNEKKMIAILLVILVIVIGIFITTRNKKEETNKIEQSTTTEDFYMKMESGKKINTSKKVIETKKVDMYEISAMRITTQNNNTVLTAYVKNTSNTDQAARAITIVLYDQKGQEIKTIPGVISPVKAGETVDLKASISSDYANTYDYEIKID